jgi:hypothetical protein
MLPQSGDDATLARSAVRSLDDPTRLRRNPLLDEMGADSTHATLRACVLRALDSVERLHPYLYGIIVRCDVHGEAHKRVYASLARSRRQFYRERHEALTRLAAAIRESAGRSAKVLVEALPDAIASREQLIDMLGGCGQYAAAHEEALLLAARIDDPQRKIALMAAAASAARFMGDYDEVTSLVARARGLLGSVRRENAHVPLLWAWIAEIALKVVQADFAGARTIVRNATRLRDESLLYGAEARLFSIILTYAVTVENLCGNWTAMRALLRRIEAIAKRTRDDDRAEALLRFSSKLALQSDGDLLRAQVDQREALGIVQGRRQVKDVAKAVVDLGVVSAAIDPSEGAAHVNTGLSIAERFPDFDGFAMMVGDAVPVLVSASQRRAAEEWIAMARSRGPLSGRAVSMLDLADARLLFEASKPRETIDRARGAAEHFAALGMLPAACDARMLEFDARMQLGHRGNAERAFRDLREMANAGGRIDTRNRVEQLGKVMFA